jgi:hypothetical protein
MAAPDPRATSATGGYQPDPAAEGRMTIDAFFDALTAAFPAQTHLDERLRSRHHRLFEAQRHRIVDEASRHNLALALAVLAAHQELAPGREEQELLRSLQAAFVEPLQPFVRAATRAALDPASDPFDVMVSISRERERHAFGAGFAFRHPDDGSERYTAEVERCYYHDVLRDNGAAQLTPIFCAFDANWIDAIDPDRDGFEFDRLTTIGTGGTSCLFRFRRRPRT